MGMKFSNSESMKIISSHLLETLFHQIFSVRKKIQKFEYNYIYINYPGNNDLTAHFEFFGGQGGERQGQKFIFLKLQTSMFPNSSSKFLFWMKLFDFIIRKNLGNMYVYDFTPILHTLKSCPII